MTSSALIALQTGVCKPLDSYSVTNLDVLVGSFSNTCISAALHALALVLTSVTDSRVKNVDKSFSLLEILADLLLLDGDWTALL